MIIQRHREIILFTDTRLCNCLVPKTIRTRTPQLDQMYAIYVRADESDPHRRRPCTAPLQLAFVPFRSRGCMCQQMN